MKWLYDNLSPAYNNILRLMKKEDTEFTSIILVCIAQLIHLTILLKVFSNLSGVKIIPELSSKYYTLLISLPWFFIVYKYYSKQRQERIMAAFGRKTIREKHIWGSVAVATLAVPFLVWPFL